IRSISPEMLEDGRIMPIVQVDPEKLERLSDITKVINFQPKRSLQIVTVVEPQKFHFGTVRAYGNDGKDRSSRSGQLCLKNGIKPILIKGSKLQSYSQSKQNLRRESGFHVEMTVEGSFPGLFGSAASWLEEEYDIWSDSTPGGQFERAMAKAAGSIADSGSLQFRAGKLNLSSVQREKFINIRLCFER
ncbi:hypothetical protein BGZ68_001243, partial [Mortierella alpina]